MALLIVLKRQPVLSDITGHEGVTVPSAFRGQLPLRVGPFSHTLSTA